MTNDSDDGRLTRPLTALFGEAHPGAVFSDPIQSGEDIVITAAAWDRAGGFGWGSGGGGEGPDRGEGGGGGGGGSSEGRPVAVIRITPDGIEVEPIIDVTKIAVTGLLAAIALWRTCRSSS